VRGFLELGIVGHVEQATNELRELVGEQTLAPDTWRMIEPAVRDLVAAAELARFRRRPAGIALTFRGPRRSSSTAGGAKSLLIETGATGLEPATSGVTGRRSNQLNYAPGTALV
jgi:hypothetical protein